MSGTLSTNKKFWIWLVLVLGRTVVGGRPKVSSEIVMRSTQLAHRLCQFEKHLLACFQLATPVVVSPEYIAKLTMDADLMLDNTLWSCDSLKHLIAGMQVINNDTVLSSK